MAKNIDVIPGKKCKAGDTFIGEAKMHRVLHMIIYLMRARRTLYDFMERFDISERTAYRYLKLIDVMNFGLEKGFDNKYFIVTEDCPLCGEKHKSRSEHKARRASNSSFTSPAFLN